VSPDQNSNSSNEEEEITGRSETDGEVGSSHSSRESDFADLLARNDFHDAAIEILDWICIVFIIGFCAQVISCMLFLLGIIIYVVDNSSIPY
jgi:hypothetical protein